jgi:riboflavin kinase/FMN adenylyltransferase
MRVIRDIRQIRHFKNTVAAIGVFDGLHLGHRMIIADAVSRAKEIKGTSLVLTFYPHPQGQLSLYSLEHRLKIIEELNVDVCAVMRFNSKFSKLSASDFIRKILFEKIRVRHIYVGENFRFGKNALGNVKTLAQNAALYGYQLHVNCAQKIKNKIISSTLIRGLINEGDLRGAEKLLLRPVSILGIVIRGESFGRGIGFPTANIDPHHEVVPPLGIYAVNIFLSGEKYRGVCYIGMKPTVSVGKKLSKSIEVHIFRFNKNIYKRNLEVQFIKRIRKDEKFHSVEALVKQIKKDILKAKEIFSTLP